MYSGNSGRSLNAARTGRLALVVGALFFVPTCVARAADDWASIPRNFDDPLTIAIAVAAGLGALFVLIFSQRRRSLISQTQMAPEGLHGAQHVAERGATPQSSQRSELLHVLSSCRWAAISIGVVSGISNVLMLTGAFFMLQVYDRVLPSRSLPTLVALGLLVAVLFAALAAIDVIRGRILVRIGASLNEALGARVYETIVRLPLKVEGRGYGLQPLHDLDTVRSFISGPGPMALFDLPWMPLYLAIIFAFHPVLGFTTVIGGLILVGLTFITEYLSRGHVRTASVYGAKRNALAEAGRRNAEAVVAMGMAGKLASRWVDANQRFIASHQAANDVTGGFGSVSRALRLTLQSAVLGVGAYLVIMQQASAGIIIASAILVSRALAPVDQAIANWKGLVAARQSWKRLHQILKIIPAQTETLSLHAPRKGVSVETVSVAPPGGQKFVVHDVNFSLQSGQGLGIIGPSASGKSSLVRAIVGAWQAGRGCVRLDGAALDQYSPDDLGRYIGYLPQDVELFSGTVAENIARFDHAPDADAIIGAAQAAGVHDLIVGLPKGYETEIGEHGQVLSAGQRQRVALARALYRDPFLVVLDEPNSNLDSEGEAALQGALAGIRERGGIAIVVAHRPSALAAVDFVLVMGQGRALTFGPKEEVLPKVLAPTVVSRAPVATVSKAEV